MSKKHFIALANAIRLHNRFNDPFTTSQLETIAQFLKSQNGNFKGDRWFDYINGKCGPNGGKV